LNESIANDLPVFLGSTLAKLRGRAVHLVRNGLKEEIRRKNDLPFVSRLERNFADGIEEHHPAAC